MKKVHRFITDYTIVNDTVLINDLDLVHQWKNVLKFKIGEEVILANKNGEALCAIVSISKNEANLQVVSINKNKKEHTKNVTLYMAILKRENFELVVQKASEVGIDKIVPIITEHTVKTGLKYERLEKIAREASELSGRNTVPYISETIKFSDAVQHDNNVIKILFDISGKKPESKKLTAESLSLYIGPEGGFSESEINLVKSLPAEAGNNFEISSLGPLTLRAETAGIIASYLAVNL